MDTFFYFRAKFKCSGSLASNTKLTLKLFHQHLASHPIIELELLMMVASKPPVFQFPCLHLFFLRQGVLV